MASATPSPAPAATDDASAHVVLHGGEPTLHPAFEAVLEEARASGRPLLLETNGRAFAVEGRAVRARRAGLEHATVTLLGGHEAAHDFLAGAPGSFRQTVAGAMRLRAAGVRLTVRLVVTRSSVLELASMTTVALGLGAVALRYSWARMEPRPEGYQTAPRPAFVDDPNDPKGPLRVDPNTPAGDRSGYDAAREWLVPRYALALEPLVVAVRAAQRAGRQVLVDGVPACLAPPGVTLTAPGPSCYTPMLNSRIGRYAPNCDGCALRARCPGVPSGYLARFGHDELKPVRETEAEERSAD